jgi:hypothetical protein
MALLLYCATSGQVLALRDDQEPFVDPATYGAGTRIIPYPQDLSTLPVMFPGPPPIYSQPPETTALLLGYAAQVRFECSTGGLPFTPGSGGSIPVSTARADGALLNNLATWAASVAPTTAVNFTQDNVCYPITAQDVIDMFNQTMAHVQACRNIEADCIADLNSGSPTILTYDDVDAKFAGVFAKTLRGGKGARFKLTNGRAAGTT